MSATGIPRRLAAAAAALAILALAASLGTVRPAAAETRLRITTQLPPGNPVPRNLRRFEALVAAASGGGIQAEVFDSATLYKDKDVPRAVASGAIEMGSVPLTRFTATTPIADLFFLPFLFRSLDAVAAATRPGHVIRAAIEAELLETGARVLWWQPFGMAVMLSRGAPIDRPDRMRGKRIRAFGKAPSAFVAALGGVPVLISGSEQYRAYARGTVDAGMTGVTAVKSRKLHEVMDHMVRTNHAVPEFVVVINDKVWRALGEGGRRIVTDAARRAEREMAESYAATEADAISWIMRETGMRIIELSDAQHRAFQDASAAVIDAFVRDAGPIGRRLVDEARKLR